MPVFRVIQLFLLLIISATSIGWSSWGQNQQVRVLKVDDNIYISNNPPSDTGWRLYNNAGTLYWNGSAVETGAGLSGLSVNTIQYANTTTSLADSGIYRGTTGNIGIGTTVPLAKLQVEGAIYGRSGAGTPTWSGVSLASAGDAFLMGDVEVDGRLYTDGGIYTPSMTITGSNITNFETNVGIGSTTPRGALDVEGNVYIDGHIYQFGSLFSGGSSQWTGTNPIYYANNVGIGTTVPQAKLQVDGNIYLFGNTTGRIGIGTTSPRSGLDIWADSSVYLTSVLMDPVASPNSVGSYAINLKNHASSDGGGTGIAFSNSSAEGLVGASIYHIRRGANSFGDLAFATKASGGNNAMKMLLNSNGNLGIGTSVPLAMLQVEGAIYGRSGAGSPTWPVVSLSTAGDAFLMGDVEIDGKLYVDNSVYLQGNVGINTVTASQVLQIGAGTTTNVLSANPNALLKGDIEVDGKIYVDGGIYFGASGIPNIGNCTVCTVCAQSKGGNGSYLYLKSTCP